jgi:small subunit ribosomal protein S2
MAEEMLVKKTEYLTAGMHIGMKSCTPYMRQFVYKIRDDGLAVFNLRKVDMRILTAANFLSQFDNILIVSRKSNAAEAVNKFAEVTESKAIAGRFSPGTLTNPSYTDFFEPGVVVSVDPLVDENAIKEAKKKRIPMVALCDTFNEASDVDLLIPANNNGKKSMALIFMLLAREILKKRGKIKKDSEFKYTIEDFGGETAPAQPGEEKPEDSREEEEKPAKSAPKKARHKAEGKADRKAKHG